MMSSVLPTVEQHRSPWVLIFGGSYLAQWRVSPTNRPSSQAELQSRTDLAILMRKHVQNTASKAQMQSGCLCTSSPCLDLCLLSRLLLATCI